MSIAIIDYGAGNLRSVQKALEKLGFSSFITKDKAAVISSHGIILPGVGAFDSALKELRSLGIDSLLKSQIEEGKPFLGLCLGMQVLFEESEEGREKGLGLIKGRVKKFSFTKDTALKVPHMGWNNLLIKQPACPIMKNIPQNVKVYFVHSYYCEPQNSIDMLTETDYGLKFASSVSRDNLFALQFHPEKSGEIGLEILKNFGGLCK
ncbi:MAG: imidazole glycerol phosphate synthase subunit HisH [Candidatus Margulisiibacteriota bacterium]